MTDMNTATSALSRATTRKSATAPRADRKGQILLAAERLFAKFGFHAVSIRQIAQEAQVPLALVGYHYGQKQDLFHAIFEHWSSTIAERMHGLQEVQGQAHSRQKLQRIVEAFISPVIRLRSSPEGESYAMLMTKGLSPQSDEADWVLRDFFDPMAEAFIETEAANLMRFKACELFDQHQPCGAEANMAKYLAAKASWEAANVCLQTHGGFGFACEYDIERKFRETRLYQVAPVSTNMIFSYVAEHILGLPRSF